MKKRGRMDRGAIVQRFRQGDWLERARRLLADPKNVATFLRQVSAKNEQTGRWQELKEQIQLFFQLVQDWYHGRYPHVDQQALLYIVAGLLYFVVPLDFIPDWILGLGYLDDAAVIAFIIKQVHVEMERYQAWREEQEEEKTEEN